MKNRETVVASVGDSSTERLTVVLRELAAKPIVIRTQTFSESVGWFTQQEIELTRSEFNGLRNVLGLRVPQACTTAVTAANQSGEGADILSFAAARQHRA